MKKILLKSLTFIIAGSILIGCIVLAGCGNNDNDSEYKKSVESAQKLLDKAEEYLQNAYRINSRSWYAESENELQDMIGSDIWAVFSIWEADGKDRFMSNGSRSVCDVAVVDNMVYYVGDPIPDWGIVATDPTEAGFNPMPMQKYAFADDEYDDMIATVFGVSQPMKAEYFENITITKLDDGKTKLSMSGATDLYFQEAVVGDVTVLNVETEIIFDTDGRYLWGSSRFDTVMHLEYNDGSGIVKLDQTSYSYTESTYEYHNINISAPENADEYELIEYNWKK